MKERLRELILEAGFDDCGVASLCPPIPTDNLHAWLKRGHHGSLDYMARHAAIRANPEELLTGAKAVVMVALGYNQPSLDHVRIARYALGRDYHKVIRSRLKQVVRTLCAENPELSPQEFRIVVDSAPFLERSYAQRAGLGWPGKNTLLIHSRRGSWFFLAGLLTTLELEADTPSQGGCGTCTKCIEACPTGAILQVDGSWQVDARKCISALTIEHRGAWTDSQAGLSRDHLFGCDICQEVCPFNAPRLRQPERAQTTRIADFGAYPWPDLESMAQLSESEWLRLTEGSALRRLSYSDFQRNVQGCLDFLRRGQDA
mgnify:CR=1 FL=1